MNNDLGIIEKIDLLLSNIDNKSTYNTKKSIIYKFIKYIGIKDIYDSFDAIKFYNSIQDSYSGMSMHLIQQNIKWLYKRMNFDYGYISHSKSKCVNNIPIDNDDVINIISNINIFSIYTQFVIAMSVVYGLRRIEICNISISDIDIDKHTIFINTAKSDGNSGRWMYIPDEILNIVRKYVYMNNVHSASSIYVSSIFWLVIDKLGINITTKRGGWHMIRRRLIIELMKVGLTDSEIVKFMRWKYKDNNSIMLYRYSNTEPNDEVIENIDKKVFELHPFLKYFK